MFTNYRVIDGLRVDGVSKILEDKAGNIWFGAVGGLVRYNPGALNTQSFTGIKIPAATNTGLVTDLKSNAKPLEATSPVSQIMQDSKGVIWFCVGYNVYYTDGKSDTAITTGIGNFLKSEKAPFRCAYPDDFGISGIYEDKNGNICIATKACSCGPDVTYQLKGNRTANACILNRCGHDLHNRHDIEAHNTEIAECFTKLTWENGNTKMAFNTVFTDKSGTVWVGTDSGVYNYNATHFTRFAKNDMLNKSVVNAIYEDKSGALWFSTGERNSGQGNGVFRYDGALITQFTTKDGLCNNGVFKNNFVSSISEDNTGKLWFAGYGGVCCYDGKTFTNFTAKDGFNQQPVNCIVMDKHGNMWFGAWELGLYCYDGISLASFTESRP